jgi:hypothetical protein
VVRNQFFKVALAGTIALSVGQAGAQCVKDAHPTLQNEKRATSAIIEGEPLHAQELKEDPKAPSVVTATLYDVRVVHTKRGRVASTIQIRSDNTASRFPMQIGRSYILFLKRDGDIYTVDACGHSGKIAEKRKIDSSIVPSKHHVKRY